MPERRLKGASRTIRVCSRNWPGLSPTKPDGGIELAIADLEEHGEIDELDANVLRRTAYTEAQVLEDWFPEEPPR